jgi:hypothetical protein
MAGTRGFAQFRGEQLNSKILRDYHFDSANKISEDKVNILWSNHREILTDTKIDVYVQKNNVNIPASASSLDITADVLNATPTTDVTVEGTVVGSIVEMRKDGTADFPFIDANGDRIYGKVRYDGTASKFYVDFYSVINGTETAYTFANAQVADYKYVTRTNLGVIPVDAITSGGGGLVADAVDAQAYMNLQQLMVDLYGAGGHLDNDGNANLATSVVDQIANEIQARTDADTAIRNDLASTAASKGASLIGVVADSNYTGVTVQAVLSNLASRLATVEGQTNGLSTRDANTTNGYFTAGDFGTAEGRINNLEQTVDTNLKRIDDKDTAQDTRLTNLETEDEEEIYEATGGETSYTLVNGVAKDKTVFLFLNGQALAPGINFAYTRNGSNQINGFNFAPDTLKVTNGVPDVLLVKYKKIL